MKILSTFMFTFLFFSCAGQDLGEGLQGYYSFNGGFTDSSESQIEGEGFNVIQAFGVEEVEGTAYDFNGTNAFISLQVDDRSIKDLVSISAWVKTENNKRQFVVSKYNSAEGRGYFLGVEEGRAFVGGRYDNNEFVQVYGTSIINDGEWHHIAGIVDGSQWTIWVDCGVENTTESQSNNSMLNCSDPLTVGSWFQGNGNGEFRFFDGVIDEVRIYNKNIMGDEIPILCDRELVDTNEISGSETLISLYPNPTADFINIFSTIEDNDSRIYRIVDITRRILFESRENQISVRNLADGTYLLQVLDAGTVVETIQFVKQF